MKKENEKRIREDLVGKVWEKGEYMGIEREVEKKEKGEMIEIWKKGDYGEVI